MGGGTRSYNVDNQQMYVQANITKSWFGIDCVFGITASCFTAYKHNGGTHDDDDTHFLVLHQLL